MNNEEHNHEGHFYKGLFYGMLLGIGAVWFLGTKEGQKMKDELLARGQNLLEKAETTLEAELIESVDKPKK